MTGVDIYKLSTPDISLQDGRKILLNLAIKMSKFCRLMINAGAEVIWEVIYG